MKILILNQMQFGYHVDSYMYSKYLADRGHNIIYLSWDCGLEKVSCSNVQTIYVPRTGNLIKRNLFFLKYCTRYIASESPSICFIKYFRGCAFLKLLFPNTTFVFDIRTGSVRQNRLIRYCFDFIMYIESLFFKHITIVSQGLAERLHLSKKAKVIPPGSVNMATQPKTFDSINLLYVGTLANRKIEKTILGFAKFLNKFPTPKSTYTIIGEGYHSESQILRSLVKDLHLEKSVRVLGRIPFDQLTPYFETHNIGISFVPITSYFNVQPVTKTFDYLLSGMPVIATATDEHKRVINDENGVLIDDSTEGVIKGLELIQRNLSNFDSNHIKKKASNYHRKFIIKDLERYFENITKGNVSKDTYHHS